MQRVLELVFRPTASEQNPEAGIAQTVRRPDTQHWVAAIAAHEPLAQARHDQAKFTTELHHCDDPPSGDPAWQCLVLDAGARRFAIAVHDFSVLPGVRVRSWEPVALGHDQLPDFAGQCGDVPWRAEIERHWWRLDLDGEPLTISLDAGVLSAPVEAGVGGEQRPFVELRISLELADVDNPDDAAPDEHSAIDDDARVELAERAVSLFDLAISLNTDGWLTLVEHDALTYASRPLEGPHKAGTIEFGSRPTYEAVAAAVTRNIFAQWVANAHSVAVDGGSEYVHQMRIALRRMRTAYRFFGSELRDAAIVPEKHELKWIGGLLGDLRDWDVLIEDTFPAIVRAAHEGEERSAPWSHAEQRVAAHREEAASALRAAMASGRYAQLLTQVARQVAVLVTRSTNRRGRALNPEGRKSLRKQYRKLAHAVDLHELDAHERHQLRIRAKRLRYAIEFLAPALDGRQRKRMAAHVSALQDALGSANDAIVGRRFLAGVDLDPSVRMFAEGYLTATEAHGVACGIDEIEKIKQKR
ncbi:triphosphatase [Pararobbsia alpina]|uniref:CHAD domain-containing protein n=1 Tax=Pararobbsia alpina TaxID=621374 RepID=UPI0039A5F19D